MYPVLLRLPDGGDPVAAIAAQLARVPNNGIGHGMLKFTARDPGLTAIAEPRLAVNYMGTFGFDEVTQTEELFEVCKAPYGETEDGTGAWPYDLDVGGVIVGGRLRIDVGYGTAVYRAATAAAFLDDVTARLLGLLA
jgi:non-ribosomal peptide synthase protein (TIGR01720 family)